jgi:hypothetical protein
MLSFSTEFPVPDFIRGAAFNKAVQTWLAGSRYTLFTAEALDGLGMGESWEALEEGETVESLNETTSDSESIAIVYRKTANNLEWITTIVFAAQPASAWISVRVECEPTHPTAKIPIAKKPVLVKALLDSFDGAADGEFKVGTTPVVFAMSELDLAADCIQGKTNSYLPIIYISTSFNGHYLVDPNSLAESLSGMAHVVVEPNRAFSIQLMRAVQRKNVYGGTIALYWPE